jgi:hypothetical protein
VRDHGAVSAEPARYRRSLLDAVTDDGLEELTDAGQLSRRQLD